jgi:hypothetical protein
MIAPGLTDAEAVIVIAGSPGLSVPAKVQSKNCGVDAVQFHPGAISGSISVIVEGMGAVTTIGPEVPMLPVLVIEIWNCVMPPAGHAPMNVLVSPIFGARIGSVGCSNVSVGVAVLVCVAVAVLVAVFVEVRVAVDVNVLVTVGVFVGVLAGVAVFVGV